MAHGILGTSLQAAYGAEIEMGIREIGIEGQGIGKRPRRIVEPARRLE